jgi:hypothetical protein
MTVLPWLMNLARNLNINNCENLDDEEFYFVLWYNLRSIKGLDRRLTMEKYCPYKIPEKHWDIICSCSFCDNNFPCEECGELDFGIANYSFYTFQSSTGERRRKIAENLCNNLSEEEWDEICSCKRCNYGFPCNVCDYTLSSDK